MIFVTVVDLCALSVNGGHLFFSYKRVLDGDSFIIYCGRSGVKTYLVQRFGKRPLLFLVRSKLETRNSYVVRWRPYCCHASHVLFVRRVGTGTRCRRLLEHGGSRCCVIQTRATVEEYCSFIFLGYVS